MKILVFWIVLFWVITKSQPFKIIWKQFFLWSCQFLHLAVYVIRPLPPRLLHGAKNLKTKPVAEMSHILQVSHPRASKGFLCFLWGTGAAQGGFDHQWLLEQPQGPLWFMASLQQSQGRSCNLERQPQYASPYSKQALRARACKHSRKGLVIHPPGGWIRWSLNSPPAVWFFAR